MRFSTISALVALAASVSAQTADFDAITSPTLDQTVATGSTLDIIWQYTGVYTGPVTIQLLQGATPSTLVPGQIIKAGIDNSAGKYSWAIPSNIAPYATYGFTITNDTNTKIFQYSNPFHITGASSSSSSSSATGSSTVSPVSTKTMTLSTGSAYTPSSSMTSSANITSTIQTTSCNSTTLSTAASVKPTGNFTLSTMPTPTATSSSNSASQTSTSTSTATPAAVTKSGAVANVASGSLALIGGLVLALAL